MALKKAPLFHFNVTFTSSYLTDIDYFGNGPKYFLYCTFLRNKQLFLKMSMLCALFLGQSWSLAFSFSIKNLLYRHENRFER